MSNEAIIFDAVRTPRGRGRKDGALNEVPPIELLATLFRALRERNELATGEVDDVIAGCVMPVGDQGADIARSALLYAGWDQSVPGFQINRFCASGLEAVTIAAEKVRSGWSGLVVGGGVESMSRVPMMSDGGPYIGQPLANLDIDLVPQGVAADLLATIEGYSREMLDEFAIRSQRLAGKARDSGWFSSVVPVKDRNGMMILERDEAIRPDVDMAALAKLKPSFQQMAEYGFGAVCLQNWPEVEKIRYLHTPGNSSGIVDGAALVLVGSAAKGKELGLKARARVVSAGVVGVEPSLMLHGPAPASKQALAKARMKLSDIDLIECNEAFAAVPLRFMREMGIDDMDRLNVNGGAIALGHPLGATGAMLVGQAIDELERRGKSTALITLCVGLGMGQALIIERV
ncbi:MAG: acetyl-CoA C-acetyltransferase [Rectinemataceae bacterium]